MTASNTVVRGRFKCMVSNPAPDLVMAGFVTESRVYPTFGT
jgi:hypothetical protein